MTPTGALYTGIVVCGPLALRPNLSRVQGLTARLGARAQVSGNSCLVRLSGLQKQTKVIKRIRTFLKATYPPELELPPHPSPEYKNLEYSFLEEFATSSNQVETSDIDRYLDSPPVAFKLKADENQTQ
jgi:hypothetical protein